MLLFMLNVPLLQTNKTNRMEPLNIAERRKKLITLGILVTVTVVLLVIAAASFRQFGAVDTSIAAGKPATDLLAMDENLHNQLNKLQQLDQQYAAMLTDNAAAKNFDSLNKAIAAQEDVFRTAIDSLERTGNAIEDESSRDEALRMISSFKYLLQSRKSIATLRNAVAVSNPAFSADEKQLIQLQNELMDKDEKISDLETSLALAEIKQQPAPTPAAAPVNNTANETRLRENMVLLESKIATLTETNNALKEQYDQLKQRAEQNKNTASAEADLKTRNNSLQQKIDDLNAELRLAQVDCNISRVDATQIISNAKQRKQLLSEASSILTDLSTVNNADVRQKVKDKIAKLNQVAANSRE